MTPTPPTELPKLVGVWTMSQYTTEEPSKGYTKVSVHALIEEIESRLQSTIIEGGKIVVARPGSASRLMCLEMSKIIEELEQLREARR